MIKKAKVKVIRGKWYREVFPEEGMGKRQWLCIHHDGKTMWNTALECPCYPNNFNASIWAERDADHLAFDVEIPDPKPKLKVGDTVSIQLASDGYPRFDCYLDRTSRTDRKITVGEWANVKVLEVATNGAISVKGFPADKGYGWHYPSDTVQKNIRPAIPATPTPETWSFKGRLDVARVLREANYRPCVVETDDGEFRALWVSDVGHECSCRCSTRERAEQVAREGSAKARRHTVTVLE